jgi:hypothetical protein
MPYTTDQMMKNIRIWDSFYALKVVLGTALNKGLTLCNNSQNSTSVHRTCCCGCETSYTRTAVNWERVEKRKGDKKCDLEMQVSGIRCSKTL